MTDATWARSNFNANVMFSIVADAEPGVIARLTQHFARRDILPDIFSASRTGETLLVEIVVRAMPATDVHLVEGNISQTVGVRSVARSQELSGRISRQAA